MSIDAVIERVEIIHDGLNTDAAGQPMAVKFGASGRTRILPKRGPQTILHLCPRLVDRRGGESIPGQRRLIIPGIDTLPRLGLIIWGGASSVTIHHPDNYPKGWEAEYLRTGYTWIYPYRARGGPYGPEWAPRHYF